MTNKIEVTLVKNIEYESDNGLVIKFSSENDDQFFFKHDRQTYYYLSCSQAKELAEILPEFIKKIEEEM